MHASPVGEGLVVRAFRPGAVDLEVTDLNEGRAWKGSRLDEAGFFEVAIPEVSQPFPYRLKWETEDGAAHGPFADPYSFWTILGEADLYYFGEGTHRRAWDRLGAHPETRDGVEGVSFAVWAPNARRVSVIGDFNFWDGRVNPMRKRIENGIWEIFIPHIGTGQHYKFEIVGGDGDLFAKSDPFAFFSQHGVATASITHDLKQYAWGDGEWMRSRASRDPYRGPVSIYEVHLGSW
ncbi:MAG: 1,4-alpha-glucan branching enzyme, partial [Verrucomicrobiae bacterium]|nr:1,4-alpha-glucan branching enzyme [Verrucomicrobiae bacterium]